ncbi:D-alanyl-D-alanine carboxypeptidase [Azospirillum lipoferum]|uniref:D-alanyl-D-alanine carboxypeptidase n=1 Tax=Azospirillum lipoferum TaxID=193 RepID=A0A5A9GT69_AZOLI|nr:MULTISPECIES: D-alanyl-D-alanine carboxypeptidase family protein [Azospirillum]KAA0597005.1 D-alanyl-D-alanine carboxypeptidase [Azospirillum lipoferum]MCP1608486.1 D-alanyl-D-alanine carboxypeptidase [Azospirillum lipoferum]MDW5536194.1 D-alanyl-D-alanine carboxypeptidase family protein [Azospirillum sp. NL1]
MGRHLLAAAALLGMVAVGSGLSAAEALAAKAAAIVVDARTGQVLIDQDADAITHPASLTKMMTLYLTFDALEDGRLTLDQQLPVSSWAESMSPTKLGLRAGQTLKVETAILGLVTKSANDAAVVLAEALGGTESRFAEMMTRKARELGMRHTVYRNASGLPNMEQVTTARDYAALSRALMRDHAKYYPYFSRRNFVYGGRTLANHNHLMSRYEGMDGIKTGYTVASGFNLAASAVRDGRRLVGVVLGGKSAVSRDNKMAALLDQAFGRPNRGRDDAPVMASLDTTRSDAVDGEGDDDDEEPEVKAKPVRASLQTAAVPAPIPVAPTREEKSSRGGSSSHWGVQVGAFSSKAAGNKAVSQAVKQAPFLLRSAKASVVEAKTGKETVYRARLTGLDEKDARKACAVLTKHGHHCVAVSPGERG